MATTTKFRRTFKAIVVFRKYHNSPQSHRIINGDITNKEPLTFPEAMTVLGHIIEAHCTGLAVVHGVTIELSEETQA